MKIGIFTDDYYPIIGGMGAHVFNIVDQLQKTPETEVFVFSSSKNNLPNHKTVFSFSRKFGRNVTFSLCLNVILPWIIKAYSLDMIHIHSGNGGVFLLRRANIPCIVTAHTNSYLCHYYKLGTFFKLILSPLERITYHYAHKIIAVSDFIKQDIIDSYHVSEEKIQSIPNGVDTKIFRKMKGIDKVKNSLLFVGRLDKRKGVEFLIKALPLIKKDIPSITLFIIGDGPDKAKLVKLAKQLKLNEAIVFKGFLEKEAIAEYYNLCEICIIPSIVEGFGLTLLESLACETRVISTREVGALQYVPDNSCVSIVDYNNYKQLSMEVISLLEENTPDECLSLTSALIRKEYTWDQITRKTLAFYKNDA